MRRRTYFFISFFVIGIFAPLFVFADSNNVTSFVFTTNPQSIATNTLSPAITIQTENIGGTAEKVSETNDVTFTSTSATGQFLNSGGSAVSTTMSTNTATRTFYYEDSTAGTYTLMVTIKGRTSGKQFSATQTITITGTTIPSSDTTDASSTDDSTASTTSDASLNNSDENSAYAYSSQSVIYEGSDDQSFNISIGRNRLVSVGEPVTFEARIIPENASFSGMLFHWAFGDGTEWNGLSATHTYEYPGNYIVVVDASRFGDEAVAEAKIKVVTPHISVSNVTSDFVTIENSGDDEINIGNWAIADTKERYVIPQDTIVAANSSVTIPATVMKAKEFSGTVDVYGPSNTEDATATIGGVPIAAATSSGDISIALPSGMNVDEFTKRFSQEFSDAVTQIHSVVPSLSTTSSETNIALSTSSIPEVAIYDASSSAAAVIYSIPHSNGSPFFSGVYSWFGNLFGKK